MRREGCEWHHTRPLVEPVSNPLAAARTQPDKDTAGAALLPHRSNRVVPPGSMAFDGRLSAVGPSAPPGSRICVSDLRHGTNDWLNIQVRPVALARSGGTCCVYAALDMLPCVRDRDLRPPARPRACFRHLPAAGRRPPRHPGHPHGAWTPGPPCRGCGGCSVRRWGPLRFQVAGRGSRGRACGEQPKRPARCQRVLTHHQPCPSTCCRPNAERRPA